MKKVSTPKVVTTDEATKSPPPSKIREALGEVVGAARGGPLALSVDVGLGVVHEMMELEVDEAVGPKRKHHSDRVANGSGRVDDPGRPARCGPPTADGHRLGRS